MPEGKASTQLVAVAASILQKGKKEERIIKRTERNRKNRGPLDLSNSNDTSIFYTENESFTL
jgi:hypothetical protein